MYRRVVALVVFSVLMMVAWAASSPPTPSIFGRFPGHHVVWTPPKKTTVDSSSWDHYCPPCQLQSKKKCLARPCQRQNIQKGQVYDGIEVASDPWMRLAARAALVSVKQGGGPFAAVIVQVDDQSGQIIRYWVAHNQVVKDHDPTAHAEVMTIREVAKDLGVVNLGHVNQKNARLPQPHTWSHCIIYSSAEPCPMCLSAIYWAGIKRLYFTATRFDAAAKGVDFSDNLIYQELARPYAKRKHMQVRHSITNNALDAFNYYKRRPVARYGQVSN